MDIMKTIFACVKQMAWSVTFVIPIVLIARCFLRKISSHMCYLLWGIVAVRLLCPILLPSDLSLFHGMELVERSFLGNLNEVSGEQFFSEYPDAVLWESKGADSGIDSDADGEAVSETQLMGKTTAKMDWLYEVWLTGLAGMSGYAVFSCLFLRRKLRFATRLRDRVYESDVVGSPFVFGVIRPRIYLPYRLPEEELDYILMHERYHIWRKDYLIKWFAYVLLAMYWFHPLVWAAYFLMNQDMEASCDEYVLRDRGMEERKKYGRILLRFSSGKWEYLAAGLGFGERSIKSRMKHILHQKKQTVWSMVVAVAFLAVVTVICLTDSRDSSDLPMVPGENTEEGAAEPAQVSQAAQELFEASNPYIGDASANGRLLGAIATHNGGLEQKFTTELQTSEEPYVLTLHFEKEPDETKMWENALLFLALTENCGEVRWDYTAKIATTTTSITEGETEYHAVDEGGPVRLEPYETDSLVTFYVSVEDANVNLGVDDIKEYGTSVQKVAELLELLDVSAEYSCKGTVLMNEEEKEFFMLGKKAYHVTDSKTVYADTQNGSKATYVVDGEKYIVGGSAEVDGTESEE